jgi:hypothetical protein
MTVAFLFVRNEVEGPASAAEKLSASFVSAPAYRQASDFTVETRREAEMRTALIVAITLAFAIDAHAQTRADRSPSDGSVRTAGKGRVETQARCEARQQQIRDPVSGIRIQAGDAARFCNRQRSR